MGDKHSDNPVREVPSSLRFYIEVNQFADVERMGQDGIKTTSEDVQKQEEAEEDV